MATIGAAVAELTARFAAAGLPTPRLDARVLVADALGLEPALLFARAAETLPPGAQERLARFAERRLAREPVSRIRGLREFFGLTFRIAPATLDPRPETETLVEAALRCRAPGQPARLLDLGTGSGCILLAALSAWPEATGLGIDISPAAVAIAAENAARLGLAARASFATGDWGHGLAGSFAVIVSNPPYISDAEMKTLDPEVANFDPAGALRGGSDGLDAYRRLVPQLPGLLSPEGQVFLEVGATQAEAIAELLLAHDFVRPAFYKDLAGVNRVVGATGPGSKRPQRV